jgi:type 1 fimbria pilin
MMKKFAFLAAATAAVLATPAMAQNVTGTITLNGTVASKCTVTSAPAGATFAQTVNFGELAQADGTLRSGLSTDFSATPVQATVVCNTATPKISVDANPMVNVAAAATGYANTINYTANVAVTTTTATNSFSNATTAAAGAATAIGGPLANSPNNVVVTTTGYATPNGTDILVAGSYTGNIVIVISPT